MGAKHTFRRAATSYSHARRPTGRGRMLTGQAAWQPSMGPGRPSACSKPTGQPDAELDQLMHDLLRFLLDAQCPSGELPYRLAGDGVPPRQHYLCFQYNAFEFLAIA